MAFTHTVSTKFHPVTCCECSCTFAIDDSLNNRARVWKQHSVYCPSCGTRQGWDGETPEQKIKRELECELARVKRNNEYMEATARQQRERAEAAERSLSATKGVVTRIKNRVSKGVCPCCNRTFADLQRHMHTQHPEYAASEV